MPQINSPGRYRGRIIAWGLQDARESQSVAIYIKCQVNQFRNEAINPPQWEDLTYGDQQGPWEVDGVLWIINKQGQPLQEQIERFMQATGWSGRIEQITGEEQWDPADIQFSVEENVWKERKSYRISFIYAYDSEPRSQMAPDKVQHFKRAFGSQLRAIGQNALRNAPRPSAPQPPARPVATPAAPQTAPDPTQQLSQPDEPGCYQGPDGKWYSQDGTEIPF